MLCHCPKIVYHFRSNSTKTAEDGPHWLQEARGLQRGLGGRSGRRGTPCDPASDGHALAMFGMPGMAMGLRLGQQL